MKTMSKKIISVAIGLATALTAAASVVAAEKTNVYINPAIGMQSFDNQRNLDDEKFISLGLEYRFGPNWAVELNGMDSSPDVERSNNDVDLTQYGIDGIYYFAERDYFNVPNKFEPYGVVGLGHAEFDARSNTENETQGRVGLGLRYLLSDHWSIKADTRLMYGFDDDSIDKLVMLGVSYAFNPQGKKSVVSKPEPVAMDSDGDGVIDSNDRCPSTPAGVAVDASGCALDSDNDGVADYKDQCPDTPAGRKVDEQGCKYTLTSTEEIALNITFANNSSVVSEQFMPKIEAVAEFMKKYGATEAVVEGDTDNTGSEAYNQALSQRRADAVVGVLVNRFGIAAERLRSVGHGESRPIADNNTAEGRKANRRVTAVIKAEVEK
ncbi:MAG: OmpA family protein [Spongiibacteraceae bacterium]